MPVVELSLDSSDSIKGLNKYDSAVDRSQSKTETGFSKMKTSVAGFTTAAAVAMTAAAVAVGAFSLKAVNMASSVVEAQGVFDQAFAGMTDTAEVWAKELGDSYHLTELAAKQSLSTFQLVLTGMDVSTAQAAEMSNALVRVGADLGAAFDRDTVDVVRDIRSALSGSMEVMDQYGVVIRAAQVEQKALEMELAATAGELTQADKATATYALILEKTAKITGTTARESEGYAGQLKEVKKNIGNLTADIGSKLLPAFTNVLTSLNTWYTENEKLIGQKVEEYIGKIATGLDTTFTALGNVINGFILFNEKAAALGVITASAGDWGLIGAALFVGGPQAGLLVAALVTVNNQLSTFNLNIGNLVTSSQGFAESFNNLVDVATGKRDWNTGELLNQLERGEAKVGELDAAIGAIDNKKAFKGLGDSVDDFVDDLVKAKNEAELLEKQLAKLANEQEAAVKEYEKVVREVFNATGQLSQEFFALERSRLTEQTKAWIAAGLSQLEADRYVKAEMNKLTGGLIEGMYGYKTAIELAEEATEDAGETGVEVGEEICGAIEEAVGCTESATEAVDDYGTAWENAGKAAEEAIEKGKDGGSGFNGRPIIDELPPNMSGTPTIGTPLNPDKVFGGGISRDDVFEKDRVKPSGQSTTNINVTQKVSRSDIVNIASELDREKARQ